MIAITGANGNLGRATISFLLKKTSPSGIIAVVRDPAKISEYAGSGIQVRVADYDDPASLRRAFKGADSLLQISSSSYGDLATRQEQQVVEAAKESGVAHIAYTSTLQPGATAHFMAGRTCHHTETLIRNSGLRYTIFRNSMYMETIPLFIGSAMEDGQIYYPGGEGRVSFVSRIDIAEALANVLAGKGEESAVHDITGSESASFGDIARLLRSAKGLPAAYTSITAEAYRDALQQFEMPGQEIDFYLSMAGSIRAGEFARTGNALEQLLQRPRLALSEFMRNV